MATFRFKPEFVTPASGSNLQFTPGFTNYVKSYLDVVSIRRDESDAVIATYADGSESVIGVVGDFPIQIILNGADAHVEGTKLILE